MIAAIHAILRRTPAYWISRAQDMHAIANRMAKIERNAALPADTRERARAMRERAVKVALDMEDMAVTQMGKIGALLQNRDLRS